MGNIIRMSSNDGFILASAIDSTDIVERAKNIHQTTATATAALGRALSVASLIGVSIKIPEGSLTMQFKGSGPAGTLVVVSDEKGNVRGYLQNPGADVPRKSNGKLDVGSLIGTPGYLTVIKDLRMSQPYIGTVELLSGEIADDVAIYYVESEQIPTACAAGVLVEPDGTVKCSGAYLIQLMPGGDPSAAEFIERTILKAGAVTDMLRNGHTPQSMLRNVLEGIELHQLEEAYPEYKCYCSRDRVEKALISAGKKELQSMADEQGNAEVTCQFCDARYQFSKEELLVLMESSKR